MSEKANSRHIKRHSETSNPIFFLDDDPGFRQRISVSRQVRDILENDRYNFSSNGEVIASSTFYNRVLTNILRFNQEPDKLLHIHGIPLLPDVTSMISITIIFFSSSGRFSVNIQPLLLLKESAYITLTCIRKRKN